MENPPEYSLRLGRLVAELGISQAELSALSSVDQSTVSYYLSGRREPGKFACIVFAGLSKSADDRAFWLALADISTRQGDLIEAAFGRNDPESERRLVSVLLQFWYQPDGLVLESLRDLLKKMLFGGQKPGI
jgi:transcriptional regulator with XRE-family HTH domain